MERSTEQRSHTPAQIGREPEAVNGPSGAPALLTLQALIGNRAVNSHLSRLVSPTPMHVQREPDGDEKEGTKIKIWESGEILEVIFVKRDGQWVVFRREQPVDTKGTTQHKKPARGKQINQLDNSIDAQHVFPWRTRDAEIEQR